MRLRLPALVAILSAMLPVPTRQGKQTSWASDTNYTARVRDINHVVYKATTSEPARQIALLLIHSCSYTTKQVLKQLSETPNAFNSLQAWCTSTHFASPDLTRAIYDDLDVCDTALQVVRTPEQVRVLFEQLVVAWDVEMKRRAEWKRRWPINVHPPKPGTNENFKKGREWVPTDAYLAQIEEGVEAERQRDAHIHAMEQQIMA